MLWPGILAAGVLAPTFGNMSWAAPTVWRHSRAGQARRAAPGSDPAATALMKAALRHGGAEASLHYVSTSVGSGVTTTIVGDVGKTVGTQTIYVKDKKVTATMVIRLVGHEAYFKGAAEAIYILIGLTPAQSEAAAGRWISVMPSDSVYNSTAAALTVGSVMSEITLSPPVTRSRAVVSRRPAPRGDLRCLDRHRDHGQRSRHRRARRDQRRGIAPGPVHRRRALFGELGNFRGQSRGEQVGRGRPCGPATSPVPLAGILKATTTTTTTPPVVV